MGKRAAIIGAGQTYHKSIRRDVNGQELINEAVTRALEDAELTIDDIDGVLTALAEHQVATATALGTPERLQAHAVHRGCQWVHGSGLAKRLAA